MRPLFVGLMLLLVACSSGRTPDPAPTSAAIVTEAPAVEDDMSDLGKITFGTKFDRETLLIDEPRRRFKRNYPEIAWSAQFIEAAGSTTITLIMARVSKGGAEEVVVTTDVDIANPTFSLLANSADLASIADNKAGKYVLRYLRDSTVLAEGEFELVK
jgi:hypothetical protein